MCPLPVLAEVSRPDEGHCTELARVGSAVRVCVHVCLEVATLAENLVTDLTQQIYITRRQIVIFFKYRYLYTIQCSV